MDQIFAHFFTLSTKDAPYIWALTNTNNWCVFRTKPRINEKLCRIHTDVFVRRHQSIWILMSSRLLSLLTNARWSGWIMYASVLSQLQMLWSCIIIFNERHIEKSVTHWCDVVTYTVPPLLGFALLVCHFCDNVSGVWQMQHQFWVCCVIIKNVWKYAMNFVGMTFCILSL